LLGRIFAIIRRFRKPKSPHHRVFGAVGAHKSGPERVGEVAAELGVRGADAVEGAANQISDRFAHAFGGIARRARPTAEPVCGGELLRDDLDFMPNPLRLSEVSGRSGVVEFSASFRQALLVLRRGPRIENRPEVALHAHGHGAVVSATPLVHRGEVAHVQIATGPREQPGDVVQALRVPQAGCLAAISQGPVFTLLLEHARILCRWALSPLLAKGLSLLSEVSLGGDTQIARGFTPGS
jgi:hypothetical protein